MDEGILNIYFPPGALLLILLSPQFIQLYFKGKVQGFIRKSN